MRRRPPPDDAAFLRRYPHQLSGGQQQRVAIAMAAILRPQAIVMDEPTTGLDVTTQAHILRTVRDLCKKHQVAMVYVSHDLAVVGKLADRVLVIYAGRAIELGPTGVLHRPVHPYTRGLVGAIPVISEARTLATIPGNPPSPGSRSLGCRFADRCSLRLNECTESEPELTVVAPGHSVRCIRTAELLDRPLAASVPKLEGEARSGPAPLLAVNDLVASYGATRVLHGVSFELGAQECAALVGESGSGKTTLARCIVGLTAGWEGDVKPDGQVCSRGPPRTRSRGSAPEPPVHNSRARTTRWNPRKADGRRESVRRRRSSSSTGWGRGIAGRGSSRRSNRYRSRAGWPSATPTSSLAGSASASRSRAHSCASRRC